MPSQRIDAQNKRRGQRLCKRYFAAAAEKRRGIFEQGLNLLLDDGHEVLRELRLLLALGLEDLEPEGSGFGEPRVNEEVDACASQCVLWVAGSRPEGRWVGVGKKCRDDAGLSDNFAIEVNGGDKAALALRSVDV